jgi:hypothetical protein
MAGASPAAASSSGPEHSPAASSSADGGGAVKVTRITFTTHTGPKLGLTQAYWVNRKEPLQRIMSLLIEWGDLKVATSVFLHGGSRSDPTRGTRVFCDDTADSLILASDDYIDIVSLDMLSGHTASQAASPAKPSQAPPAAAMPQAAPAAAMQTVKKQLRSPSRSPPRTRLRGDPGRQPHRRRGYEETQGDSFSDDEKFPTNSSS